MTGSEVYSLPEEEQLRSLCYFPSLPRVRIRRCFEADTDRKTVVCTKKSSGHPSLLPGIFTIFCPHGLYGIQLRTYTQTSVQSFSDRYLLWFPGNETL